jgi:hypothetical protein
MIQMDLAMLWYGSLELPLNVLTLLLSLVAAVVWFNLVKRMSFGARGCRGWWWVFSASILVIVLNVAALLSAIVNERVESGFSGLVPVDVNFLDFATSAARAAVAATLVVGAYFLLESVKEGGMPVLACVNPQAEARSDSDPKYDLRPGVSYLVKEGPPGSMKDYYMHADRRMVTGFELFSDLVTHGTMGFAATRRYPPKVREETGLLKTPMVWLTQEKGYAEIVRPGDLAELSHIIKDFIAKGGDTVILLEGFEYLILHNSFEETLRFVQSLDDVVVQNSSRLIVTIDPAAISEQQYHLLSRELTEYTQAKT